MGTPLRASLARAVRAVWVPSPLLRLRMWRWLRLEAVRHTGRAIGERSRWRRRRQLDSGARESHLTAGIQAPRGDGEDTRGAGEATVFLDKPCPRLLRHPQLVWADPRAHSGASRLHQHPHRLGQLAMPFGARMALDHPTRLALCGRVPAGIQHLLGVACRAVREPCASRAHARHGGRDLRQRQWGGCGCGSRVDSGWSRHGHVSSWPWRGCSRKGGAWRLSLVIVRHVWCCPCGVG